MSSGSSYFDDVGGSAYLPAIRWYGYSGNNCSGDDRSDDRSSNHCCSCYSYSNKYHGGCLRNDRSDRHSYGDRYTDSVSAN
jgi:hypothetical protein